MMFSAFLASELWKGSLARTAVVAQPPEAGVKAGYAILRHTTYTAT